MKRAVASAKRPNPSEREACAGWVLRSHRKRFVGQGLVELVRHWRPLSIVLVGDGLVGHAPSRFGA